VRSAYVEVVTLLLEHGASVGSELIARQEHVCTFVAVTAEGETRAERGRKNKAILKLLKDHA
jgi:uncharacterized protein YceH (UPF0502 family)